MNKEDILNPYIGKAIFVQIAAFRDKELIPTLADLFDKANEPENLHVCVCWQHSEKDVWDKIDNFSQWGDNIEIIDINADDSKGVCWARNLIQQKYKSEDFTLQLDSHHRFVEGWDTELKNEILQLQLQGYKKPLLTGYITSYHPSLPKKDWGQEPWQMMFDRFTPDGVVFFSPAPIPDWKSKKSPIPARFYSAHFCFTLGKFCTEVPHDPRYYFHGEEITIGVRAYTKGYDLFHPHKIIAYHEFTRDYRPDKHWDTYSDWGNHNENTYRLMKELLGIDGESCTKKEKYGKYGIGKDRSIADWENYAGIRFLDRALQQETIDGVPPPNTVEGDWCRYFKHCINLDKSNFNCDDIEFIAVALHNDDNETLLRKDIVGAELSVMLSRDNLHIWIEGEVTELPAHYVVWPFYKNTEWGQRYTGDL